MTTETIKTRSEILFVYDIADANPNGDPNDENRPRMDLESGRAKVSDVRLKRTIRDYLKDYKSETIFCCEIEKSDGTIQEGKDRAEDFFAKLSTEAKNNAKTVTQKRNLIQQEVIKTCIDVRLFGATIPVSGGEKGKKGSSVTLTGAVQFAMGGSLHRVEPSFIKGTGAFASGQGAQQRTFREEYVLPYALIAFYGIVNQQGAKATGLMADDVEKLYEAIWYGTKNLITRSKMGHRPLLLLTVDYKLDHANSYIGRLDRFLSVTGSDGKDSLRGEAIRDSADLQLNLTQLVNALTARKDKIEQVRFAHDSRLPLSQTFEGKENQFTFAGITAKPFKFE